VKREREAGGGVGSGRVAHSHLFIVQNEFVLMLFLSKKTHTQFLADHRHHTISGEDRGYIQLMRCDLLYHQHLYIFISFICTLVYLDLYPFCIRFPPLRLRINKLSIYLLLFLFHFHSLSLSRSHTHTWTLFWPSQCH